MTELRARRAIEPGIRAIVADRKKLKLRVEILEAENQALRRGSLGDVMALEKVGMIIMATSIRKRIGVKTVTP